MTKVDMLRDESGLRFVKSKTFERFLMIESGIDEVRIEIDTYRDNIIRAKEYLNKFRALKAMHLKKRA
jgi:hypothetical protein